MRRRLEPVVSMASLFAVVAGILLIAAPVVKLAVEWAFSAFGY